MLYIGDLAASNCSYGYLNRLDVNDTGESAVANFTVYFSPPANFTRTGYQNLTVINPDGGSEILLEQMFFTNDCPFIGVYSQRR